MNDFSDKIVRILNHGALNLALGMGYAHKIFDIMDDLGKPVTLRVLVDATGLDRRYLEEWLGVMVTGDIITLSPHPRKENAPEKSRYEEKHPNEETYYLPPAHGDVLTRRAGNSNLGVYTQEIPLLTAAAMEAVQNGFITGHGVPFSNYPRFQTFMSELANARFIVKDAAKIKGDKTFHQKYDYVTAFDAIHDQSHPLKVLEGIRTMLKPGGFFSMVDIKAATRLADNMDHPMGPFLYTISLMHCMPVGLNDRGRGLGMMWGKEQALALLSRAGFDRVDALEIPDDPFNLHFLCRKLPYTEQKVTP
jgi:hypothetical protein